MTCGRDPSSPRPARLAGFQTRPQDWLPSAAAPGPPVPLPLSRSPVGHVMPDSTSRASALLVKGSHGAARPPHAGKGKEPACPLTPGLLTTLHIPGCLLRLVGGVWRGQGDGEDFVGGRAISATANQDLQGDGWLQLLGLSLERGVFK